MVNGREVLARWDAIALAMAQANIPPDQITLAALVVGATALTQILGSPIKGPRGIGFVPPVTS